MEWDHYPLIWLAIGIITLIFELIKEGFNLTAKHLAEYALLVCFWPTWYWMAMLDYPEKKSKKGSVDEMEL